MQLCYCYNTFCYNLKSNCDIICKTYLYLYWGIYSFKDLVYKTVVIVRIKLMDINLSLSLKFIMSSVSLVFKCNYFSSDQHNKWYFDIKTSSCPFSCIEVATDSEPTLLISHLISQLIRFTGNYQVTLNYKTVSRSFCLTFRRRIFFFQCKMLQYNLYKC